MSEQEINIESDLILCVGGSCINRYGGCGILYMINDTIVFKDKYMVPEYPTSIDRANLYSIYYGLLTTAKYIQSTYGLSGNVHLFTDSLISIESLTSYIMCKKSRDLRLADTDILERIYPLLDKVTFHHVDEENKLNKEVNMLARDGTELSKAYFTSLSIYGTYNS